MGQSRLLASPKSEHLDAASGGSNLAPEMPRRMFQALVLTRPIASVSSLVTELPPSFGTSAMLVAVSVQCEAIAARNLVLRSILIKSPEWHIQPLPAQPALPFALTSSSCWQSIYKLGPLAKSTKEDALRGLGLLNISDAPAAESSGRGVDAAVNDSIVHVLVEATDSARNEAVQAFRRGFPPLLPIDLGGKIAVQVRVSNNTSIQYSRLCLVDGDSEPGSAEEEYADMASHGLLSLNHATAIPPLRPGESTSIVLHYVAAAPHFHTASSVRLLDQEAGGSAGQTLATFESPFIVYVDDHGDNDGGVAGKRETPV
ncbi:hypothetical protein IW146_007890 [Coemansia sp. RSA 922]|nr:hypothetical protein IW146_007890 [Coemansia sp. RSA 922]